MSRRILVRTTRRRRRTASPQRRSVNDLDGIEWRPSPGDELIGTVVGAALEPDRYQIWIPIVIVEEHDTNRRYEIWARHASMQRLIEQERPAPGSLILARYISRYWTANNHSAYRYLLVTNDTLPPHIDGWYAAYSQTSTP
jgi:hypothetical protein